METRILGRTGLEVSVVGFGGIPIQRLDDEAAISLILEAVDAGVTFFDTARGYSDSEEKIGRALERCGCRDRVVIATKALSRRAKGMASEIRRSLRTLRTNRIELYQLHNVSTFRELEQVLAPGGAAEAVLEAKADGLVEHIGITGHNMDVLLEAVKTGVFETIQYPHNSIETSCEEELIPAARAAGIGRIGMKPAGGGALEDVPLSIRFILTRGTDAVIPGVESVDQLRRNIAAAAPLIHPDRNEMEFLEREAEELGPTFCRRCGYCLPCPNGLNIPFLLLLPVYYKRYKLEEWAAERVRALDVVFDDCDRCGICETRCPYGLPIMDMLSEGNTLFSNLEKK